LVIEVFSQPNCVPCRQGKSWLAKHDVDFVEHDVTTDPEAFDEIVNLGYTGTPVFKYGDEHFQGIDLNTLKDWAGIK